MRSKKAKTAQPHTQIITIANRRLMPNAPKNICAISMSKFPLGRTLRIDMTPPTSPLEPIARRPRMNDQTAFRPKPVTLLYYGWKAQVILVNKTLTRAALDSGSTSETAPPG
jgi:hypothetical protein